MDEYICVHCLGDEALRDYIERNASEAYCTFCGETSDHPIAVGIDDFLQYIRESIYREYDDAANCLPYESAEGGFLGAPTYDAFDLVVEELELDLRRDTDDELLWRIVNDLSDCVWCKRNPFGLDSSQVAIYSWDRFSHIVKHERRYYFSKRGRTELLDETLSPAELLKRVLNYAETAELIREHESGLRLYRARRHNGKKPWTMPDELGPPPVHLAVQANRMSPAGIVMFYGSEDAETALRETALSEPGYFSVGEFKTTRKTILLDLSHLPTIPSIFEEVPDSFEYDPRRVHIFLQRIADRISLPVARDNRVHIDYVPTQVVSEYVRTYGSSMERAIDGIIYTSSVNSECYSCVLFATSEVIHHSAARNQWAQGEPWLELVGSQEAEITEDDIRKWRKVIDLNLDDEW